MCLCVCVSVYVSVRPAQVGLGEKRRQLLRLEHNYQKLFHKVIINLHDSYMKQISHLYQLI